MAVITSPENHRNLARYREIAQRLAHAEGLTEDQARAFAREGTEATAFTRPTEVTMTIEPSQPSSLHLSSPQPSGLFEAEAMAVASGNVAVAPFEVFRTRSHAPSNSSYSTRPQASWATTSMVPR